MESRRALFLVKAIRHRGTKATRHIGVVLIMHGGFGIG
jgi:hypothetical protein